MKNVKMEVKGNILTITVDLSKEFGTSASKKNIIIGTTGGNVATGHVNGSKVGVNVYKAAEE